MNLEMEMETKQLFRLVGSRAVLVQMLTTPKADVYKQTVSQIATGTTSMDPGSI
jgi:hypothetical protein